MTKGDPKSWRQPSEQEKGEIPISSTNKFKNSPAGQKFIQQKNAAKLASAAATKPTSTATPTSTTKPTSTAPAAKPQTTSSAPTKPAPGSTTSKPITSQPFVSKSQSSAAEIRGMIGRSMERQAASTPAATPRTDVRNRDVSARGGFDPRFDRKPKPTTATTMKQEDCKYDAFDIILEYLIAEGYADTNKNALVIMANMSEDWKQSILEMDDFSAGGGNAKMKKTGMTKDQVIALGKKNLAAKPASSPTPSTSSAPSAPSQSSGTTLGATPSDVALYRLRSQEKDREFRAQARANERTPDAYRRFLASQEREKNRPKQEPPMGGYGYKGLAG